MEVFKFGGASVNSPASIRNVGEIIRNYAKGNTLIVFSAMGKMTNAMEAVFESHFENRPDKGELLEKVFAYHLDIIHELFLDKTESVYEKFDQLSSRLQFDLDDLDTQNYNLSYDRIVSYGERFSSLIMSAYLDQQKLGNQEVDASKLIITDSTYREANVDWQMTEKRIRDKAKVVFEHKQYIVTQGFIVGNSMGECLTLGREGSDYSASIFAYCLPASRMLIWKDVSGVLNADPKYFKSTQKLDFISYSDATELAYYGASVIHPKTIKPLQNKNIALEVRSFLNPAESGTLISNLKEGENTKKQACYILKPKQVLLSIRSRDFSFIEEDNLALIFSCFADLALSINLMQNSALSFSVCVDAKTSWRQVIEKLASQFDIYYNEDLELITIRHYSPEIAQSIIAGRPIVLEQKSRQTLQVLVKQEVKQAAS